MGPVRATVKKFELPIFGGQHEDFPAYKVRAEAQFEAVGLGQVFEKHADGARPSTRDGGTSNTAGTPT